MMEVNSTLKPATTSAGPRIRDNMLISLTVGKVDAGIAILLTEDRRLIEFPSILLPSGISSGSIVDIQVSRNAQAELTTQTAFNRLQEEIYNTFGIQSPSKPQLRLRNATQTLIVLEWDPIDLATATLRSLTLYRNGAKAGSIPNPTTHTTTKISGLAVDTEYTFHLVLKTSAGTYSSDKLTVRTHKMTDLSGITVCPGVMPSEVRENLEATLARIGAKPLQDFVRIDTTQFVCTEGRGQGWERATEMNIPVVRPEWVDACESQGRIVGVRSYYLNADPRMRPAMRERPRPQLPQQQQQAQQGPTDPQKEHSPSQDPDTPNQRASETSISPVGHPRSPSTQVGNNENERSVSPPVSVERVAEVEKDGAAKAEETRSLEPTSPSDLGESAISMLDEGTRNESNAVDITRSEKKSEEGFETVPI